MELCLLLSAPIEPCLVCICRSIGIHSLYYITEECNARNELSQNYRNE